MILMTTLTALVILFPRESVQFSIWCYVQAAFFVINCQLFWFEWNLYRQLRKDFEKLDYEAYIPPFKFVPLQYRDLDE